MLVPPVVVYNFPYRTLNSVLPGRRGVFQLEKTRNKCIYSIDRRMLVRTTTVERERERERSVRIFIIVIYQRKERKRR